MLDALILVPFQGYETLWLEPQVRRSQGPARMVATLARDALSEALGADVSSLVPDWAAPHRYEVRRTAGAIALASSAERAGVTWHAIDPGEIPLEDWRKRLEALAPRKPRLVAINTTFVNEVRWLHLFCSIVRHALPGALVVIGGYFYATDARGFLSAPADVFCIGEGEVRFGEIARRIREGRSLSDVPGLFLKDGDGRLRSTGDKPALDLGRLPLPDWALSCRMDPPVDPTREPVLFHVETQRGCYFKCEFCTFRTLSDHSVMSPERAAEALLGAARGHLGRTFLADATGTFPRDRFEQVLEKLEAQGGSPQSLSVFARVSDLDPALCARMARVGIRHAFIGQESGDQRILNAMRKGTKVSQVRPALNALAESGIKATFGFISGFPGEDAAATRATRELMVHLNDGHPSPTVLVAYLDVFAVQDLATVSARTDLSGRRHAFDYGGSGMSAQTAAFEALRHCVALSEHPLAPVTGFGLTPLVGDLVTAFCEGGDHLGGFAWLKAFDRGVAEFVRRELHGGRVDSGVLRDVKSVLLSQARRTPRLRTLGSLRRRVRSLGLRGLRAEWQRETDGQTGVLTRILAGTSIWHATRDASAALAAFREGAARTESLEPPEPARVARDAAASTIVQLGAKRRRREPVIRAQSEGV